MRSKPKPRSRNVRYRGFTLLEMLLVLAVLLALASLAWPPVQRLYAEQQIKDAVEQVRGKLAGTRLKALDAGLTYQFRFEPEGTAYLLLPYDAELVAPAAADAEGGQALMRFADMLPEGMRFEAASENLAGIERLRTDRLEGLPNPQRLSEKSWSPPLLFYSDGSAMDAAFDVVDEENRSIRLSVRGLTGGVTVSKIEFRREL